MVVSENIANRIAVRDYISLEMPGPTKCVLQKELICAGRLTINCVVGAHDGIGMAFDNRRAKCGSVCVQLVVLADVNVSEVTRGLRPTVNSEMLRRRDNSKVVRIVSLHSGDERHSQPPAQERIFSIRLLSAAPAGIAEDIDVRCPEIQSSKKA